MLYPDVKVRNSCFIVIDLGYSLLRLVCSQQFYLQIFLKIHI